MNMELFKAINGLAYKNALLDKAMIVFSAYVPIAFMIALAVLHFYGVYRKEKLLRYIAVDILYGLNVIITLQC